MTVSVVIPCFNRDAYLSASIQSVIAQADDVQDICVVNDGSTDATAAVMAGFGDRIIAVHQQNKGVCAARNAGLRRVSGSHVVFLDADDLLKPVAVKMFRAAAERHDTDVIVGSWEQIDRAGRVLMSCVQDLDCADPFHAQLRRGWGVPFAYCIRRASLDRVGAFDESQTHGEDWDLWLRLAASNASHARITDIVGQYRWLPDSASTDIPRMWSGRKMLMKKHRHRGDCRACREAIHAGGAAYYWHVLRPRLADGRSPTGIVKQLMRCAPRSPDLWVLAARLELATHLRIRGGVIKRTLLARRNHTPS